MGGFDLDGTLITGSTILIHVGRHLGRSAEVRDLVNGYESYRLSNQEVSTEAAQIFAGLSREELLVLMDDIPYLRDISEVVSSLKARDLRLVVATISFDFAAEWFHRRFGFDNYSGIVLEFDERDRATGKVLKHVTEDDKAAFVAEESARHGIALRDVFYVGDSRSDLPTFRRVGWAVALNATPEAKEIADASVDTQSLRDAVALVPGLYQP